MLLFFVDWCCSNKLILFLNAPNQNRFGDDDTMTIPYLIIYFSSCIHSLLEILLQITVCISNEMLFKLSFSMSSTLVIINNLS